MGYIASVNKVLRKVPLTGWIISLKKKPRILCTAGVILVDSKGRILLQLRGDDNNWCIPGGALEIGESVETAAMREVFEETGIIVNDMKLFNIYSGNEQYHIYPDGNEFYFVSTVFISSKFHGDICVDGVESKELKFFSIHDLPYNISPTNKPMLKDLVEKAIEF